MTCCGCLKLADNFGAPTMQTHSKCFCNANCRKLDAERSKSSLPGSDRHLATCGYIYTYNQHMTIGVGDGRYGREGGWKVT